MMANYQTEFNEMVRFAIKLGYNEQQVKQALDSIGYNNNKNCTQNELLTELIKISNYCDHQTKQQPRNHKSSNHLPLGYSISSSILLNNFNKLSVGKTLSSPVFGSLACHNSVGSSSGLGSSLSSLVTTSSSSSSITSSSSSKNHGHIELRPIVIDGSNVAMLHGKQKFFSCKGIEICVNWFRKHGHKDIKVFVPSWRKCDIDFDVPIKDREILLKLEQEDVLIFTPSRTVSGKIMSPYDDQYILKHAHKHDAIIVSNDQFRDLTDNNEEFKKIVNERLLMYLFLDDDFSPPDDPLGPHGPRLKQFLSKPSKFNQICPYDKKCTYGLKCKYLHPERQQQQQSKSNPSSLIPKHRKLERQLTLNPDVDPRIVPLMNKKKLIQTKSWSMGSQQSMTAIIGTNMMSSLSSTSINQQKTPRANV